MLVEALLLLRQCFLGGACHGHQALQLLQDLPCLCRVWCHLLC
jgi:hypothetical protein